MSQAFVVSASVEAVGHGRTDEGRWRTSRPHPLNPLVGRSFGVGSPHHAGGLPPRGVQSYPQGGNRAVPLAFLNAIFREHGRALRCGSPSPCSGRWLAVGAGRIAHHRHGRFRLELVEPGIADAGSTGTR